ncbi:DUF2141 domain-containing protein [Nemorincola caseinilytica]|uniref:DUF2141 domain-containing protein n=1 Tax=Nemorincola caseinilytica TaxID=2054315 RepID=A0ABP8N7M3_9BACT
MTLLPNKQRTISLFLFLFFSFTKAYTQNVDILFSGIRSVKGQIIVKVYVDEKGFDDDKPVRVMKFPKRAIANGEMREKAILEPGSYGFALLDDENNNGVMEYSFLRMPKEGFGFSNFYLTGMKKPRFGQFVFTLPKDQKVNIGMKIRYL